MDLYVVLDNMTDTMQLIDIIDQLDNIEPVLDTEQRLLYNEIYMYLRSALQLMFNSKADFRIIITQINDWRSAEHYLRMLNQKIMYLAENIPIEFGEIRIHMQRFAKELKNIYFTKP